MVQCYILEYKEQDSRGREKNSQHVGVFKSVDELEKIKNNLIKTLKKRVSFQVYISQNIF